MKKADNNNERNETHGRRDPSPNTGLTTGKHTFWCILVLFFRRLGKYDGMRSKNGEQNNREREDYGMHDQGLAAHHAIKLLLV